MGPVTKGMLLCCLYVFVLLFHCFDCSCANGKLFGPNCNYMCHCANGEQCDDVTGDCTLGCSVDWMGPGCQYRNIAQKGRVRVSDHQNGQYAKYAVDDNLTSCTDTGAKPRNNPPWWRITLQKKHYITGLTFLTKDEYLDQFRNFKIIVGTVDWENRDNKDVNPPGQVCYSHRAGNKNNYKFNIMCDKPMFGNHVRIVLGSTNLRIVLCDVRIYGGKNIAFGKAANSSEREVGELEFVVDGIAKSNVRQKCARISPGHEQWWEINLDGHYLLQGYSIFLYDQSDGSGLEIQGQTQNNNTWVLIGQTGNVTDHLIEDVFTPVKVTRIRLFRGSDWIAKLGQPRLVLCEVQFWADCANEFCGLNCSIPCHCRLRKPFSYTDRLTGACEHGCKRGWIGDGKLCDKECQAGTYGDNCTKNCSGHCANGNVCDTTNGQCQHECEAGWQGSGCNTGCRSGRYGSGCSQPCSTHCSNRDKCYRTNGTCIGGCMSGWIGNRCDQECDAGTYGLNCLFNCSTNCINGSCISRDGHCEHGCTDGWNGRNCEQVCPAGYYGNKCSKTCNCDDHNNTCHHIDGSCNVECSHGNPGGLCVNSVCPSGYYGNKCNKTCNCDDHNNTCHRIDGSCNVDCSHGNPGGRCVNSVCPYGYYGNKCNKTCNCDDHNNTCHHIDGSCNVECSHGNPGGRCVNSVLPSTGTKVSKGLIGAICSVWVLVLAVIAAAIFIRRKKLNKRQNNAGPNSYTNRVVEIDSIPNKVEIIHIECAVFEELEHSQADIAVYVEHGHSQGLTTFQTMSGTIDSTIGK